MISSKTHLNRKLYLLFAVLLGFFLFVFLVDQKDPSDVSSSDINDVTENNVTENDVLVSESTVINVDENERMDYFLFRAEKYGFKKDGLFMLWTDSKPNAMNNNIKNDEYLNHHFMNLIQNLIKNNNNIYFSDIGANMGIFAFFTLKYCEKYSKNCYLNLYEAQPKLAKVISKTLMFNNFDSKATLNNCLLDFVGAHKLCHTPGNQGMTRIMDDNEISKLYAPNEEYKLCERVYGCEYDDHSEKLIVDENKLCRFTKIDIEGHDLVFLIKHSTEFMKNDIVFFEYFGDSKKTGLDELRKFVNIFNEKFNIYIGSSLVTEQNVEKFNKFSGDNMMKSKQPKCVI